MDQELLTVVKAYRENQDIESAVRLCGRLARLGYAEPRESGQVINAAEGNLMVRLYETDAGFSPITGLPVYVCAGRMQFVNDTHSESAAMNNADARAIDHYIRVKHHLPGGRLLDNPVRASTAEDEALFYSFLIEQFENRFKNLLSYWGRHPEDQLAAGLTSDTYLQYLEYTNKTSNIRSNDTNWRNQPTLIGANAHGIRFYGRALTAKELQKFFLKKQKNNGFGRPDIREDARTTLLIRTKTFDFHFYSPVPRDNDSTTTATSDFKVSGRTVHFNRLSNDLIPQPYSVMRNFYLTAVIDRITKQFFSNHELLIALDHYVDIIHDLIPCYPGFLTKKNKQKIDFNDTIQAHDELLWALFS